LDAFVQKFTGLDTLSIEPILWQLCHEAFRTPLSRGPVMGQVSCLGGGNYGRTGDIYMIPRKLWQTWETHTVPRALYPFVQSWRRMNPAWEHRLRSDEERRADMVAYGDKDLVAAYDKVPLGAMKADIWRYLIVYQEGGFYADLDTACQKPIDAWLPPNATLVVAPEHGGYYVAQWAFAALPRHPVLSRVLSLVVERTRELNITDRFSVLHYTGPSVWTHALCDQAQIKQAPDYAERLTERGIHVCTDLQFNGEYLTHKYASDYLASAPDYVSWQRQVIDMNGASK